MKKILSLLIGLLLIYSCSKTDDYNGEVPLAPTELVNSGASQTQISISWKDNATNESGFKIERRTISGVYAIVGTVNADVLTYTDADLTPSTNYVYRVYAYNAKGKSLTYSNECFAETNDPVIVTTLTVTTTPPTEILATQAYCGGTVTTNRDNLITQRGVVWNTAPNPTLDLPTKTFAGGASFTSLVTGLLPSTTYYIRAYATNDEGTVYGAELIFNTIPLSVPILDTIDLSFVFSDTATCGGFIAIDGGGTPVTSRGVVWSTSPNPTIALTTKTNDGSGLGVFTSLLTNLVGGTNYYIRAYATNSTGTGYGNNVICSTLPDPDPVTDIDGNTYQTVRIGTQIWTTTNLNVSRYRNGDSIPQFCDSAFFIYLDSAYNSISTDSWCEQVSPYGKLYNWYTVNDSRNLAPLGYHIPSESEWITLINYLGGLNAAGGQMKATTLWSSPNTGATNSSGFSALPAGVSDFYLNPYPYQNTYHYTTGVSGFSAYFWSTKLYINNITRATGFRLSYQNAAVSKEGFERALGMSIRLIKD